MKEYTHTLPNPERAWSRLRPPPPIDRQLLETHLAKWPELVDRSWELLGGGLRTLNLRSGDIVARIALEADHNLRKEAELHNLVAEHVRVPHVIDVADRTLLLEFVPNGDLPATEEAGYCVGSFSAHIHSHCYPIAGFLSHELKVVQPLDSVLDALVDWVEQAFSGVAHRRLGSMSSDIRRLWDENAESLQAVCQTPVLVHSDFKVSNIKWIPQEQQALILDWDFAWAGPNLFDIGLLLRWNPPRPFLHGFQSGYCSNGGTLPKNWRRLAELFDLFNLVDFLNREPADPVRNRDVVRRILQTLNRDDARLGK